MSVKAFELVPVIETVQTSGDRAQMKIECMEYCGKELYLGTNDGMVLLYTLEEKHLQNGKLTYISKKVFHKNTDLKKPVKVLKCASALDRIFVFCDSTLLVYIPSETDIKVGAKLRGISTFCVNENPNLDSPYAIQICVGRKKHIQVFNFSRGDKFELIKDIPTLDVPLQLVADGYNICAALQDQYVVYDFDTNTSQQLFPYNFENFTPIICRIGKEEFLLTANENLGMFADTQGVSSRPPVQWSCPLLSLSYFHPYILGLGEEFVTVYSIIDQQQKQTLPFVGGRCIGNFDGTLFVHSSAALYCLLPVPWEKQIEILLTDEKVEEALELTQTVNSVSMTKEQSTAVLGKIHQKAGFIYFSKGDFNKTLEHFEYGKVDVREVIALFPGFLPLSSNFVRAIPPLHGIADVMQLFGADETKLLNSKKFLRSFLENRRVNTTENLLELDTALVKLYCETDAQELEVFIRTGNISCDIKDCCTWLEKYRHYHALALLYKQSSEYDKALEIWSKIISGEYQDENFYGFDFFVECLANLHNPELTWKYAEFILNKDQVTGAKIFTTPSPYKYQSDSLKPDIIVEFLHSYPLALITYLEYIVMQEKIQSEKFHTHLAVLYVENIIKLKKEGKEEEVEMKRKELQTFLSESNLLRIHLLLSKMQEVELHREMSILYGKVEEHEKALKILVYQLKLHKEAELYCVNHSKDHNLQYKRNLFFTLFSVYMTSNALGIEKEQYLMHALDLLNARPHDFDAIRVLEIIPSSWSIAVLDAFLKASLRYSLCKVRMSKVECALMRGENVRNSVQSYKLQKHVISIHERNYCCVCKRPFIDGSFARYPNNILIHVGCMKHSNICPLTGRNFKTSYFVK